MWTLVSLYFIYIIVNPVQETPGSTSVSIDPLEKHVKLDYDVETRAASSDFVCNL